MTPYYADDWLTVWQGDCREVMAQMPAESVHTVVTSPPYWGLRDYGTATWIGGDEGCDHKGPPKASDSSGLNHGRGRATYEDEATVPFVGSCGKCGAVRQDSQLGLEPTPEEYVANMVAVFREVRRVLRADGTAWLNIGDTYASGELIGRNDAGTSGGLGGQGGNKLGTATRAFQGRMKRDTGLKSKDLVGIPWRVAFALQADGWYIRSDIIWSKPNPMPESVTDRPTKAHEYLFLLSKSPRYYYDADAVRETSIYGPDTTTQKEAPKGSFGGKWAEPSDGSRNDGAFRAIRPDRNLRSVWSIATQPYPGAHFATFPEKLVEPCVTAGTSERGVCPECGAPWVPIIERTTGHDWNAKKRGNDRLVYGNGTGADNDMDRIANPPRKTGWQRSCDHGPTLRMADTAAPAVVLDPFAGSGTTGRVAQRLGRRAVLIDLSGDYLVQAMSRNREIPLGLESA